MNHLLNSRPGSEKMGSFGNELRNDGSEIEDLEFHFSQVKFLPMPYPTKISNLRALLVFLVVNF